MTPEQLKASILQYAIQGKLVEQRAEEGNAEDLYKQIQAEKQQLIKDGKIKKSKSLPPISEDEIPFDIPDNWKWVRLGECVSILGDGLHGTPKYSVDDIYYFVNGNNLVNGCIEIKPDTKTVSAEEYEKYKKELNSHTVLVSINGTIGNVAFYNDENIVLGKSACYFNLINKKWKIYIYWLIKTDYFLKYALLNATGSTIKNVSLAAMRNFLIPLPPLAEQRRIVEKIEQLLPLVDIYAKAYEKLEQLNTKFPDEMKKAILQYAIQGKLVEQRAEEGNAEELYKQIQAEKQQLIKDGKIKKSKPLPPISADEIPFDIPDNWKWVRLGEIMRFQGGYAYKSTSYVVSSHNQIIRLGNVKQDYLLPEIKQAFIPDVIAAETEAYKIQVDDILVTMTGTRRKKDYFYVTLITEEDLKEKNLFLNQRVGCFRLEKKVYPPFVLKVLQTKYIRNYIFTKETGTANQGNLGSEDIKMYVYIPLPPLAEQKRIVEKIEQLLPLCDKLK